jgi:antitoxin (DNA-binding transcriptional repressor) of toxin-antitoxin stability system
MTRSASLSEVAANLEEYVERVAQRGERLLLTRDGNPIAEIRPVSREAHRTLGEIWDSLPELAPGDAEAFVRDLEAAHDEMNRAPLRDPWES